MPAPDNSVNPNWMWDPMQGNAYGGYLPPQSQGTSAPGYQLAQTSNKFDPTRQYYDTTQIGYAPPQGANFSNMYQQYLQQQQPAKNSAPQIGAPVTKTSGGTL